MLLHPDYYIAVYRRQATAETIIKRLIDDDFPMDRVSLLGPASVLGDDILGVYHPHVTERMKVWGEQGALWGGIWGLIAGAAGVFLLPGLGPIAAAGPLAQMLLGGLASATLTGGTLAAAGALSQLSVIIHRLGIPHEQLDALHQDILNDKYLLILQGQGHELLPYHDLVTANAEKFFDLANGHWQA